MPHDHHGHCDHHHSHVPKNFDNAFIIGIALNTIFVLVEIVWGLKANSLSLLADAAHNAGDTFSLVLAYIASVLTRRAPSARFTYGLRGSSIVASLVNAVLLFVMVGGIGAEALRRFAIPQEPQTTMVMIVAAIGILINGGTALLFMRGKDDVNVHGAFLHMAGDAVVSLGVVLSAALIASTGFAWIDPLVSLLVALFIAVSSWGLLKESIALSLQAVPGSVNAEAVRAYLQSLPGVSEVHDLHIWAMSTTEIAATAHLIMPGGHPGDAFLERVAYKLQHDHKIGHATFQIEVGDTGNACVLAPETVV